MNIRDGDKLGIKEYTAVLIICIGIKATDSTPTLLYKQGANAGWMIPIISSVIVFLSLSCLLAVLERYKNMNLIEIIYHLTGKYIGAVLGTLFFISVTLILATNIRNYVDVLSSIYFRRTPIFVLAAVMIISCYIIARLGIRAIGRTAWMALPWIIVITIAFVILVYNLIKVDYLYPIGGAGVKQILKGGVLYSGIFSEVIVFSVIFPQVKNYKSFKNSSYIALLYAVISISLMSAIYIMVMDYPPVVINSSPFHTVARLIYGGRFVSNLEAFFLLFWIIASIIRFGMYVYTDAALISYTLKLSDKKQMLSAISAIILMLSMIPENYIENINIGRRTLINVDWILMYIVPCALLFLSQRKGDYKL